MGYVFNFSVLYSNYALEAIYAIKVFKKRVANVVTMTIARSERGDIGEQVDGTVVDAVDMTQEE